MTCKKETITLTGVGDVIIDREQPETIFKYVADVFRSADISYANMEQVLSDTGVPHPTQTVHKSAKAVEAYTKNKIDVVSLATNHALDWGVEGLLGTLDTLEKSGVAYCGAGKNITEARKPVILERKGTKVGFLNYCCVAFDYYAATETKPGISAFKVWTIYEKGDYQPATLPRVVSMVHKEDLEMMVEAVKSLKSQVDVVVVTFHWGHHLVQSIIPDYCVELAHALIDVGADLILGHHTHILKGIEMYKGKAIFYSLGNFALELGKHMVNQKHVSSLDEYYGITDEDNLARKHTMIAKAVIQDGEIKKVSYIPCYENDNKEPEIVTKDNPLGQGVYDYVEKISKQEKLAVHFEWDGDEVLVKP